MKVGDLKELKKELELMEDSNNPYTERIFPMTLEEYVAAVPDPHLRSAISGHLWQYRYAGPSAAEAIGGGQTG